MEVNNRIYDDLGHMWWDDQAGFEITSLRFCMNPVRYGYFKRQMQALAVPGKGCIGRRVRWRFSDGVICQGRL